MQTSASSLHRTLLLGTAGAFALSLALSPAAAQQRYDNGGNNTLSDDGSGKYGNQGPPERAVVSAPRPRPRIERSTSLDQAPEKVSLSQAVPLHDLDLTTEEGEQEARARVRDAAYSVCGRLTEMVPHAQPGTPNCFRQAMNDGLVRLDETIWTARHSRAYRMRYAAYGAE